MLQSQGALKKSLNRRSLPGKSLITATQGDEELCMLTDKDFLKQFTNILRSCLMIRKLSTPCKYLLQKELLWKATHKLHFSG